jgi:hypothetical protein
MLHLVASVAHRDESRDKDARSLIAPDNTHRCVPVRLRAYEPIVMMLDQDVRRAAQPAGLIGALQDDSALIRVARSRSLCVIANENEIGPTSRPYSKTTCGKAAHRPHRLYCARLLFSPIMPSPASLAEKLSSSVGFELLLRLVRPRLLRERHREQVSQAIDTWQPILQNRMPVLSLQTAE